MIELAHVIGEWAGEVHRLKRQGANWQRGEAHRWETLCQLAVIASFPATTRELRFQARRVLRRLKKDPKIKGTLRLGFRTLAWALFRTSRYV
jgi:hypothetical protein